MVRIRQSEELSPLERLHQLRDNVPEGIEPVVEESWRNCIEERIEKLKERKQ